MAERAITLLRAKLEKLIVAHREISAELRAIIERVDDCVEALNTDQWDILFVAGHRSNVKPIILYTAMF